MFLRDVAVRLLELPCESEKLSRGVRESLYGQRALPAKPLNNRSPMQCGQALLQLGTDSQPTSCPEIQGPPIRSDELDHVTGQAAWDTFMSELHTMTQV